MKYTVLIKKCKGQQEEKHFSTYRDALCYATNYHVVKSSIILKNQCKVAEFKF